MRRALAKLHPALRAWFEGRFPALSEIQRKALPLTLAGKNTLILAPTGSGKTLAAFLSVLSELAREAGKSGLPNAVRAVYVSPLQSLTRDTLFQICRWLRVWCDHTLSRVKVDSCWTRLLAQRWWTPAPD